MNNQTQMTLEEFLTTPAVPEKSVYFGKGFVSARQFAERNTPETVTCFNCSVNEYRDYVKGWNQGIKEFQRYEY